MSGEWEIVARFAQGIGVVDAFGDLDALSFSENLGAIRLAAANCQALVVPLAPLLAVAKADQGEWKLLGDFEPVPAMTAIFLSQPCSTEALSALTSTLEKRPSLIGLPEQPDNANADMHPPGQDRIGPVIATIRLGSRVGFSLHRNPENRDHAPPTIQPGPRKIGEGPENLAGRRRWFGKRAGDDA